MQIAKRLVQFLQADTEGNFGKVVSVDGGVATVDLQEGLSAKLTGKDKHASVGDKIYFDDEGKQTKVVPGPKLERKKPATTPVQGCAYVKHQI